MGAAERERPCKNPDGFAVSIISDRKSVVKVSLKTQAVPCTIWGYKKQLVFLLMEVHI